MSRLFECLKSEKNSIFSLIKNPQTDDCEQSNPLGNLNETIREENLKTFEEWSKYDDAQDNFCESDGIFIIF